MTTRVGDDHWRGLSVYNCLLICTYLRRRASKVWNMKNKNSLNDFDQISVNNNMTWGLLQFDIQPSTQRIA